MMLKIARTYYGKNARRRRIMSLAVHDEQYFGSIRQHRDSVRTNDSYDSSNNNFLSDFTDGSLYQIKYASSSDSESDSSHSSTPRIRVRPRAASCPKNTPIGSLHSIDALKNRSATQFPDRLSVPRVLGYSLSTQTSRELSNREALIASTREQLAQCLTTVNVVHPPMPQHHKSSTASPISRPFGERMVPNIAHRRQDHETTNTLAVETVAWMIVLGDALLNFIDGLSIGAAFDRNILAGISISVAVMLEEVTHRLGTFAVLIRAGMSMKQAFFNIFLSACACFPGLALGIFLGDEAEEASPYIFALAGGFFLYMALVDVMRAMNRTMENASRKSIRKVFHIWALQNIGIILSVISLGLLAFYEREMDFEQHELQEIRSNSFT